ncbi:PAS domain-containing protein, partial [Halarsenatibacter silvermanii]
MKINSKQLLSDDYEISKEFLSFIDTMDENAAVLNEKGKIIFVNKAWIEFAQSNDMTWDNYGLEEDYLKTMKDVKGEDAETARKAAEGIEAVLAGERDNFTLEYPCHSHEKDYWFKLKAKVFAENKAVVMHEDITETRKMKEEIKEKNRLLEGVLNNIPDIIGIQKPDHTIMRYNKAGYEQLDMPPEDIKGQKCYKLLG